jgi:hypothetical protein
VAARTQTVERQLSFMLINMRQKLLTIPGKLLLKLRSNPELTPHETSQYVRELVFEGLEEVARLSEAAEPGWLERLEE